MALIWHRHKNGLFTKEKWFFSVVCEVNEVVFRSCVLPGELFFGDRSSSFFSFLCVVTNPRSFIVLEATPTENPLDRMCGGGWKYSLEYTPLSMYGFPSFPLFPDRKRDFNVSPRSSLGGKVKKWVEKGMERPKESIRKMWPYFCQFDIAFCSSSSLGNFQVSLCGDVYRDRKMFSGMDVLCGVLTWIEMTCLKFSSRWN